MVNSVAKRPKPVVLCILDGWGYRTETEDNAIAQANTPNWDRFLSQYPYGLIDTSGGDVGLPHGQMGNSEVGHMNIGAGRVVMQDLPRIDQCIEEGKLPENAAFKKLVAALKRSGGACHLMGLMSPGGVHSHQRHIAEMAKVLGSEGIPVVVHAFLDGRDTPPRSAKEYLETFLRDTREVPGLSVGTVAGRYYAMDRDKRWDRVKLAYDAMVHAEGERAPSAIAAVDQSYANDKTDEFVLPTVIGDYRGMRDGDGVLMANFRADRAREITLALLDPAFDGFDRRRPVAFAAAAMMTEYSKDHVRLMDTLFPPEQLSSILGEVVSKAGMKQLRIAETEKYAHVTFFLNGGEEQQYEGEDRILVPSPKVATYDLQPEMSAPEVTDRLVEAIGSGKYDFIVVNYANGDMVGHTGMMDAAIKAVEAVDHALGRLEAAVKEAGGTMIVTADHGNAELMKDPQTGEPYTQHTVGKVYAVLVNPPEDVKEVHEGRLADLAPTVLQLLGLPQPEEMTGSTIIGSPTRERKAASA